MRGPLGESHDLGGGGGGGGGGEVGLATMESSGLLIRSLSSVCCGEEEPQLGGTPKVVPLIPGTEGSSHVPLGQ